MEGFLGVLLASLTYSEVTKDIKVNSQVFILVM